jgi:uncharacterized damage-inducible protein DinB
MQAAGGLLSRRHQSRWRAAVREPTTSEPLDILLAHNRWATRLILEKCRALSQEQFHKPFPIGPGDRGGLHAILTHVVSAMGRWSDRIAGRPVRLTLERPPPGREQPADSKDRTPDELLAILDRATEDLRAVIADARRRGLGALVVGEFVTPQGPKKFAFTTGCAITHVLTHGHYHRAQCQNILRQLNITGISDTLADIDVCDWQHETECSLTIG